MKVSEILAAKSSATYTVRPTETIAALSRLLRDRHIGAAVVSTDGHSVDGVASERDIAYKLSTHGPGFAELPVSTIMTTAVVTCSPADQVAVVASTMVSRNIRHVPVVDGMGRLIGMVSLRDVLRVRVDELQRETALLRSFAAEAAREPQDRD